jgi:hypothetical protein
MPTFPRTEAEVVALAETMIAGYTAHGADFPSVTVADLQAALTSYQTDKNGQEDAKAQAKIATETKSDTLEALIELMKNDLKLSEVDVAEDPEKLAEIGWGPLKIPQSIEKPGQSDNLLSVNQGRNKVTLRWDSPTSGGAVRNYIIQRRCQQKTDGKFDSWKLIATTFQNHITLTNQPQKNILEYRVKAVNTSGESMPSNTISIVL